MSPIDYNKVKNGVETIYRLHKDKGKAYVKAKVYEGNWVASNRDQLVQRIQYILRKYQAELQAFIIKMMDGLPAKIRKAQSEGLNSVL